MTSISAFNALPGADVAGGDLLPIVDISDVGILKNKKITFSEFVIALGEPFQDAVAGLLTAGTNITLTYDDGAGTLTIDAATPAPSDIPGFNEAVDDRAAALIVAGSGITKTYNDAAGTLTITAASSAIEAKDEGVSLTGSLASLDFVGSGVVATDDGSGHVTVTISGGSTYTDEMARDAIGAALTAGAGITISVNDGADTITVTNKLRTASFQILGTAPTASEPLLAWTPPSGETVVFADDFAGSSYKKTSTGTNPASTYAMDVKKSGVSVGSISISTTGVVTFVTTGTTVSIIGGTDVLEIFGNATPDTAVGYTFTLVGSAS